MVMDKAKELIRIRNKFKASRKQFGEVFLGKSGAVIINYEKGITPIPDTVIMLARTWEMYLDKIRGEDVD